MNDHKRDYAPHQRLIRLSLMAMAISVLSTFAAEILLKLIALSTNLFFFQTLSLTAHSPARHTLGAWVIWLPVAGGLLVGLLARFGSEKIRGHGIPEAIEAILFGKSRMSPRVALLKPLSSGIVIGSGGPFGAEGPIIMTGGAIGSLIAQYFHLTAGERKTLLVAGACAGMTAIFGTPVAALLLAIELLLFELRPRSLLPVSLACATAGFARPWLFDPAPLFPLQTAPATTVALGACIVAGIACGMLGAALTHALYKVEVAFGKLPVHWMWWPAIGGLAVGVGGYLEPRALGVGYDVIADLLSNHLAVTFVLALIGTKAVIWVIALGSGTSGGVLAPVLMIGAGLGIVLAQVLPGGSPGLWALVCMAGVLGSVLGAPLTAIVFSFGLTHDSDAMLPVLLTTAVAYGFTVLTMRRSIMTEKIDRRGLHIYREYGVDPLEENHVSDLMTRGVIAINASMPVNLACLQYFGKNAPHRSYPLVADGKLLGVVDRSHIVGRETWAGPCQDLLPAGRPPNLAFPEQTARTVAAKMAELGVTRFPVVDKPESMTLIGVISLKDLLQPNHALSTQETVRERLR